MDESTRSTPAVRTAAPGDGPRLVELDLLTHSTAVSPSTPPEEGDDVFERHEPEDVLVAEVEGEVVGYVSVGHPTPLPVSEHVVQIQGLAVDPAHARQGIGRLLVDAAVELARERGAHKVALRVLGTNTAAQALYRKAGFEVEGLLRDEFLLDDSYVDDLFLGRLLDEDSARA